MRNGPPRRKKKKKHDRTAARGRAHRGRIATCGCECQNHDRMRRFSVFLVSAAGCIDSPNVELIAAGDAATLAADPPDAGGDSATGTPPKDPTPEAPPACDGRCANAGGTCTNDTCTFTCPGSPGCSNDIKCPSGMPCNITCVGKDACNGRIECKDGTSCVVDCNGENACKGGVVCTGNQCAVTCANGGCEEDEVRCCAPTCTLNGAPDDCD